MSNTRLYTQEMIDRAIKDYLAKNKNIIRKRKLERIINENKAGFCK